MKELGPSSHQRDIPPRSFDYRGGIEIGPFHTDTNIFLAPMAGCTDLPFRLICRQHGARFSFFEMIDPNSLIYRRQKPHEIIDTCKDDFPVAAQLLGSGEAMMLDAAQKLLTLVKVPFLDINFACPVKKVIKKRAGAYMLRDVRAISGVLKKLSGSLPIPITVKIRTGYDKRNLKYIADLARRCEASGASAIFVHGRLAAQLYSGNVDYESIRAVKSSVAIPVFGSGDIFTPQLAKHMLDETSCDGILIARGALGNPWIFRNTEEYLKDGKISGGSLSLSSKMNVLKKHLSYIDKHKPAKLPGKVGLMRKVALWYLRGFPHSASVRGRVTSVPSYAALIDVIDKIS